MIRLSALSTILVPLISCSFVALSGCNKSENPPPPPARDPWTIVTGAIHQSHEGTKPERCNLDGKDCKALSSNDRFDGDAIVKTGIDSRVTLQLDDATSIELLENSAVKLVHDNNGAVSLEQGSLIVQHAGEGARKGYPLRLPGAIATWKLDRNDTFAVRMVSDGGAVVTVRQGLVELQSEKNSSLPLYSGETARLSKDKGPDKRAVWAGIEAPAEVVDESRATDALPTAVPRGFGSMTARVPGTGQTISGVRLASHKVQVMVRDGFARTEIEEEFSNDTDQVLEGRYAFPLPPDASISRLALWVGKDLVEGEVLEKDRAKTIFQQIVDDTVRPRDPALLEWVSGSEFSLRIFPIPAKGSRKVILAYNQILPAEGGRVHYVYPLSLGADRATKINDFSMSIRAMTSEGSVGDIMTPGYSASIATKEGQATVDYNAKDFVPSDDFVVTFHSGNGGVARTAFYSPKESEFQSTAKSSATSTTKTADTTGSKPPNYFAVRLEAALPEGATPPDRKRRDLVITIDTSHSQSRETLDREIKLASGLLRQMDPDEQFALLACDSACSVYPPKGFSASTEASIVSAEKWLREKTPGGSSDIAGALLESMDKLLSAGAGQLVYMGDGSPSAGELSVDTIATRVRTKLDPLKMDVRFLGTGRTVDDITLAGLARTFGGTYERVQTGDHLEERIAAIGMGLRAPVVRWVTATLPESMKDVYPRQLPNLRLGQEVMLFGQMEGQTAGDIVLSGDLCGQKYELRRPMKIADGAEKGNPLVPRLWAESRIRDVETSDDKSFVKEAVDLSQRFHVMSRHTAFLVLENEKMFAEFGVQRTTKKADDQSDQDFAAKPDVTAAAEAPATPPPAAPGMAGAPAPAAKSAPRSMPSDRFDSNGPSPAKPSMRMGPRGGRWVMERIVTNVLDSSDWNKKGEDELQKLRAAATESQTSRGKRTALVRGLIRYGRFEEALVEAQRLMDADPDSSDAHELVAQAAAAKGDMKQSILEMDTQAELRPRRTLSHTLAARAFEAAGDEKRACAHWRSAAELDSKSDDVLAEVFRCRARVLDGRDAALRDAKAIEKPGPKLKKMIETLEKGEAPAFSSWPGGYLFKASVQCEPQNGTNPPHLIIINHLGNVISPWTPTSAPTGPGLAEISFSMPEGIYRTIVWGTDVPHCELLVDGSGTSKKFPIGTTPVVVKTSVELSGHWINGPQWNGFWDL